MVILSNSPDGDGAVLTWLPYVSVVITVLAFSYFAVLTIRKGSLMSSVLDAAKAGDKASLQELVDRPALLGDFDHPALLALTCPVSSSNVTNAVVFSSDEAIWVALFRPGRSTGELVRFSADTGGSFEARTDKIGYRTIREANTRLLLRTSGPDYGAALAELLRLGLMGPPSGPAAP